MPVIRFERQKSIGHIVLANPPDNLLNIRFSECLQEAVHAAGDSDIRVLLIRAEGENFSRGGDILDFITRDANSFRGASGTCRRSSKCTAHLLRTAASGRSACRRAPRIRA